LYNHWVEGSVFEVLANTAGLYVSPQAIAKSLHPKGGKNVGIIWTIVLGFVIGLIAKLLHPGKENMGIIMTTLLGIAGSFLAGVIGQSIGWYQAGEGVGFIASVIVAILLLVIYGRIKRKSPA